MKSVNDYSGEELLIIREIYESHETIVSQMHRLPGRSKSAVGVKARSLGFVKIRKGKLRRRLADLMADGKCRTAAQIERRLGEPRKYILAVLRDAVPAGEYHIPEYRGSHRVSVFKAGAGVNAVRPPPMHLEDKVYSKRLRDHRRDDSTPSKKAAASMPVSKREGSSRSSSRPASAPWWPSADATVASAVRAMVETGRAPS